MDDLEHQECLSLHKLYAPEVITETGNEDKV